VRRAAILLCVLCTGCAKQDLIDAVMMSAPRPERTWPARVEGFEVLAGDTHCHVSPPDHPSHVSRDLGAVLGLAREEKLDFVVLTPHVRARFFADPELREWFRLSQEQLRREIEALPKDVLFVPGFEYTDYAHGHVGVAFGDPLGVLARHGAGELAARPELFFEELQRSGGLLVVNHPRVVPLDSLIPEARADMSWRAYREPARWYPPEVAWITAHADAIETFNLGISYLRDRLVAGDTEVTARESQWLLDERITRERRRIASVGGSDSHGMHLRAVTWVLARGKDAASVREAIVCGRTCVRGPEACAVRARVPGDRRWVTVGGSLEGRSAELDLPDDDAEVFVNGGLERGHGRARFVVADAECSVVRVRVGASVSGPIYLGCGFTAPPACSPSP
jgi:hypothetical protein